MRPHFAANRHLRSSKLMPLAFVSAVGMIGRSELALFGSRALMPQLLMHMERGFNFARCRTPDGYDQFQNLSTATLARPLSLSLLTALRINHALIRAPSADLHRSFRCDQLFHRLIDICPTSVLSPLSALHLPKDCKLLACASTSSLDRCSAKVWVGLRCVGHREKVFLPFLFKVQVRYYQSQPAVARRLSKVTSFAIATALLRSDSSFGNLDPGRRTMFQPEQQAVLIDQTQSACIKSLRPPETFADL